MVSEAGTQALARALAPTLAPGDCLLLRGPVGAGKSAFARAVIQAAQANAGEAVEDVPSPSFTLVQTYSAGPVEIWHVDLYRISDPSELMELGLDTAFDSAVCLIEWPDLLGEEAPDRAMILTFEPESSDADARYLSVDLAGGGWDRQAEILSGFAAEQGVRP